MPELRLSICTWADFDFESRAARAFGVADEPAVPVTIRFEPRWATWVSERTWHPSQTFTEEADGWLRLEMTVHGTVEVVPWVRSFGPDVAVVAPEGLLDV